ncbi:hypothetical protein [Sporosarcina sp. ZBG7A]|uniref:hypothetical protein n=1 Tax=Sporosarcina sp. ZBG7A TaxID=1582223 RepID=UPI00057A75A7|nr:hypothetical protein [Sporosarcina sp. ZBG7A]
MLFPNMPTKTLGGQVFWQTIESTSGWKLQQNVVTEHYRILDPQNVRQAWGSEWSDINDTFKKFTGNYHNW